MCIIVFSVYFQFCFQTLSINTGGNLCKMIANPSKPNLIATGGEENDLKIWDLLNSEVPIFKAKNVSFILIHNFIYNCFVYKFFNMNYFFILHLGYSLDFAFAV